MSSRLTWTRKGARRPFRYFDAKGRRIQDPEVVERLDGLAIPPAWKDVRISPNAGAKLQSTGVDSAGRKQYRYHPDFRAKQEAAKYQDLIRFAEKLPELRLVMREHLTLDPLDPLYVCAVAIRLINLAWFRVGSDRHTKRSRTYGVTTLRKAHVIVRGTRVTFRFPAKGKVLVRTALVDRELADAVRALQATPGTRLFRHEVDGKLCNLTARRLNDYVQEYMGEEFSCKDFRTWGGTLTAAIAFAERGPVEGKTEQKRAVAAVMRKVGERLGIRRPSRAPHTSRRPLSSSISTGERSRISDPGICASSPRGISAWTRRSRRRSRCFARGAYARAAKQHRIRVQFRR